MSTVKTSKSSLQSIEVDSLCGDARAAIEVMLGLQRSPCGENTFIIRKEHIFGFQSDDGIEDGNGNTWKLFIKCPDCNEALPRNQWKQLLNE